MNEPIGYSIGLVSTETGLSTHVIRAWERRHRAVSPRRSAGGRRVYDQADVDRLVLLKQAVKQGHKISLIARLDSETLAGLVHRPTDTPASRQAPTGMAAGARPMDADDLIDACLQSLAILDGPALYKLLRQSTLTLSRQSFLNTIVQPFMEHVGRRWSEGALRIVHGHLAAIVVQAFLTSMLDHRTNGGTERQRMLIATPAGQWCQLGALAVAITAQDQGWEPIYLGPNLPSEEIVHAHANLDPQLVALSITCRVDDGFMHHELSRLSNLLDDQCPLIVGGWSSQVYRRSIEATGATICPTTQELVHMLQ